MMFCAAHLSRHLELVYEDGPRCLAPGSRVRQITQPMLGCSIQGYSFFPPKPGSFSSRPLPTSPIFTCLNAALMA